MSTTRRTARPTPSPARRSARDWVTGFVRLLLEVEAGARPARHIRPLLAPHLQVLLGHGGRRGRPPRIGHVHVRAQDGRWESVVLLHEDGRVTALAIAIDRDDTGWVVTDLGRPGQPPPALPLADAEPPPLPLVAWHLEPVVPEPVRWEVPAGWRRTRRHGRHGEAA